MERDGVKRVVSGGCSASGCRSRTLFSLKLAEGSAATLLVNNVRYRTFDIHVPIKARTSKFFLHFRHDALGRAALEGDQ